MINKQSLKPSYKNNKAIIHLLPLLLIGVLIVAASYGVFYFGQNYETPLVSKQEEVIKENIEKEGMNDWKTYENEEYGFKFKYPSQLSNGEEVQLGEYQNAVGLDGPFNWGFTIEIGSDKTVEELIDTIIVNQDEFLNDLGVIEINGFPTRQIELVAEYGTTKFVYIVRDDVMIHTQYLKHWEAIDKIISTFEFVDNTESQETDVSSEIYIKRKPTTDDWNTYYDSIYDYSIKYPRGWTVKGSTPDTQEAFDEPTLIANFDIKELSPDLDLEGKIVISITEENSNIPLTTDYFIENQFTPPGVTIEEQEIVKTGDLDAIRTIGHLSFDDGQSKTEYEYVTAIIINPSDNKKYINIYGIYEDPSFVNMFDQILSTFEFTK